MPRKVKVSVIVPSFNEGKYIGKVFEGLRHQSFKDFEIIVVDWNSTDSTRDIARKNGARVVIEKKKGIGRARNRGAALAKSGILVFLDADTKPSKSLLKAYYDAFQKKSTIAATGPILPLEKVDKSVELGYEFVSIFFVKLSILAGRPSLVGSNFAVKKSTFRKVKGFNEKLPTYEDYDLSLRLKPMGDIVFLDKAMVYASTRRVKAWGIHGYFLYHTGNMLRYNLLKKPKEYYEPVR